MTHPTHRYAHQMMHLALKESAEIFCSKGFGKALIDYVKRTKRLEVRFIQQLPETSSSESRGIAQTWAKGCDGFFAASNYTDPPIGAIDLPHFGEEDYTNMWQKVRTMWSYAYEQYRDEYDYFYICGDDTYVVVENLRLFLQDSRIDELKDGFLDAISGGHPRYKERAFALLRCGLDL